MGRPPKTYHHVKGKPVDGVWKNKRGFYIRNLEKQGTDKREFFASLDDAVKRRDQLAGLVPTVPAPLSRDEIEAKLIAQGIPPEVLEEHPEIIKEYPVPRVVNPDYPDQDYARAKFLRPRLKHGEQTTREPSGGFTVAKAGKLYLDWYANEREDVPVLRAKAKAYNAQQKKREAEH